MQVNSVVVSVCMITYNHEKYIAQAIEGVLSQVADFEIELIIANDCSPDKTDQIVQNFISSHPKGSWIKYHKHEPNIGMMANARFISNQCTGKYIAVCEGDDYWTDPYKLQKQVDILETNLNYSASFHTVSCLDVASGVFNSSPILQKDCFTLEDVTKSNFIHTCSILYRQSFVVEKYDVIFNLPVGDYPLFIYLSASGPIHYYKEVMSVYRYHSQGAWGGSSQEKRFLNLLTVAEHFISVFEIENCNSIVLLNLNSLKQYCLLELLKEFVLIKDYHKIEDLLNKYSIGLFAAEMNKAVANLMRDKDNRYDNLLHSKKMKLANFILNPFSIVR
jgi:glycosyltransferase involved in cell wall biosynthesis